MATTFNTKRLKNIKLKTLKTLGVGAEAVLNLCVDDKNNKIVVKQRLSKHYRHPLLDKELITTRTRQESRILEKASIKASVPVPKVLDVTNNTITMGFVNGSTLAELLDKKPFMVEDLCFKVGVNVAKLHDSGIIHGDLTTSNMILDDSKTPETLFFIDFGLAFRSFKIEHQAVDIHLFKQALNSKHSKVFNTAWKSFLRGYKTFKGFEKVLERLRIVESRGRYRGKS